MVSMRPLLIWCDHLVRFNYAQYSFRKTLKKRRKMSLRVVEFYQSVLLRNLCQVLRNADPTGLVLYCCLCPLVAVRRTKRGWRTSLSRKCISVAHSGPCGGFMGLSCQPFWANGGKGRRTWENQARQGRDLGLCLICRASSCLMLDQSELLSSLLPQTIF